VTDHAGPITADDWEAAARQKLKAAIHLQQIRSLPEAYEQAGFAVECALKARIMRHERLNQWPSRERRRELYSHGLSFLLRASGLESRIVAETLNASDIGVAWAMTKEWSVDARYARSMRPKLVRYDLGCQLIGSGIGAMDNRDIGPGDERLRAGHQILLLTDDLEFAAQAAGWVYECTVSEADRQRRSPARSGRD
jgi:hypothetical protein